MEGHSTFVLATNKQVSFAKSLGIDVSQLGKDEAKQAIAEACEARRIRIGKRIAEKDNLAVGVRVCYGWSDEQKERFLEERGLGTIQKIFKDRAIVRWDKPLAKGRIRESSVHLKSLTCADR
jgi:hypothetical protein